MILAMFMNTAIDQQVEKYLREDPKRWEAAEKKIKDIYADRPRPEYSGDLPDGNDGLGLGLLGVTGDEVVDAETISVSLPRPCPRSAARCRPTSSRRTRRRTPASSPPSSRCA